MAVRTQWQIGSWTFDADSARLIDGATEIALEHRAARTLELLCQDRGQPVSRDAILARVWGGRSVSANSVAIVIGDLRRALGDDPSAPHFIATIPKRGYRLSEEALPAGDEPPSRVASRPVSWRLGALAILALLVSGVLIAHRLSGSDRTTVIVTRTANDTGQAAYQPLASALQALVTNRLTGMGVAVMPADSASAPIRRGHSLWLRSRLILWNGITTLSMEAIDPSGQVTWTAMAVAPPNGIATATIAQLKTFRGEARGR